MLKAFTNAIQKLRGNSPSTTLSPPKSNVISFEEYKRRAQGVLA
jgi:hypothetical protein